MKSLSKALVFMLVISVCGSVLLLRRTCRLTTEIETLRAEHAPATANLQPAVSPPSADHVAGPSSPRPGVQASAEPSAHRMAAAPRAAADLAAPELTGNADGSVTITYPRTGAQSVVPLSEIQRVSQEARLAAREESSKQPGGPSWSPGQAAGAPDTPGHGDYATAWASQAPDGGREWLQLKYDHAVDIREINIHESFNPGALAKVTAILPDGSERLIWEGTETAEQGSIERSLPVPPGIRSDQIRVELDTSRVPGWNEIDAIELVGADGSRQWGTESTASSYFGQGSHAAVETLDGFTIQPESLKTTAAPSR